MYYQKPKLNQQGVLSNDDALNIYKHYLSTDRLDFDGKMRNPTKKSTLIALIKNHENHSNNLINQYLERGKRVLFWSDQHFGHNNIIKYSNRPFDDKSHMDKTMINNYFTSVSNDDLVVWVGDVAFSSVEDCKGIFTNLPGEKVLILGNHDFDRKENLKKYHIFAQTLMATCFQIKFEGFKQVCNLILSHYPIDNSLLPENTLNIHGHIHTHTADYKNINVSVEQTNYAPIDIIDIIKEKFEKIRT